MGHEGGTYAEEGRGSFVKENGTIMERVTVFYSANSPASIP
jgi:hypothetical protein